MFKGPKGVIISILFGAVAVLGLVQFVFQGQREDASIARAFLAEIAAGEMENAFDLLDPSVVATQSEAELAQALAQMETYTDITFRSFSFSSINGARSSEIEGIAITGSGCRSDIRFAFFNGAITAFDIEPVCRIDRSDT